MSYFFELVGIIHSGQLCLIYYPDPWPATERSPQIYDVVRYSLELLILDTDGRKLYRELTLEPVPFAQEANLRLVLKQNALAES